MDAEAQKFMALEGLHTWATAVLVQVERITAATRMIRDHAARVNATRAFQRERHLFLIAANKVLQYIDWASQLAFLDAAIFAEFNELRPTIKDLRDMNEHVVEYFTGGGRYRDIWLHATDEVVADASSTVTTRIGNRLDWVQVAEAAKRLISRLPDHYVRRPTGVTVARDTRAD
jgi:hypothetical protein